MELLDTSGCFSFVTCHGVGVGGDGSPCMNIFYMLVNQCTYFMRFRESLLPQDPARRPLYNFLSLIFFLLFHGFKVSPTLFLISLWGEGLLCRYSIDCSVIGTSIRVFCGETGGVGFEKEDQQGEMAKCQPWDSSLLALAM